MSQTTILSDEDLQEIYTWVDQVPLSRAKRNITRDFSDGVLLSEVLYHYFPKMVELKNYSAANSVRQKLYNWQTLNNKVFRKLRFPIERGEIDALVACKPGAVEVLLMRLQRFITEVRAGKRQLSDSPEPHSVPFQAHMAVSGGAGFASSAGFGGSSGVQGTVRSHAAASSSAAAASATAAGAAGAAASGMVGGGGGGSTYGGLRSEDEVARALDASEGAEKDRRIAELEDMVDILTQKVTKLEQLVRLKDTRIGALSARVASSGGGVNP